MFEVPAGKSNGCGFGVFPQLGRLLVLGHDEIDLLVWDEGYTLGELQRLCIKESLGGDLEHIPRIEICSALEREARGHAMMEQDPPLFKSTSEEDGSDRVHSKDFLSMFYYKRMGGSEQSYRSKLNRMVSLLHRTSQSEWGFEIPEVEFSELLEEFSFLDVSGTGHLSAHQVRT